MTAESERLLSTQVTWTESDDPEHPYEAIVSNERWQIRLNDFPAEQMYTLLVDDTERFSFDDWPAVWARPG
ncbi:hypothetical protein ACFL6C_02040 [Myxococcota bacterium]